jgi:hypothetical protein
LGTDADTKQVSVPLPVTSGGTVCKPPSLSPHSLGYVYESRLLGSSPFWITGLGVYIRRLHLIPRIDPPTPLRNPRSKQHNPTLHHLQKHAWEPISRKQKERGTIKLTRGSPTHRLPRPRRPPPRSLLRQARRPACCFHGPGLKPLFPTNRYLIPRRGGTHVQQTRQSLEARESEGEESKAQMITLKPYTMFLCVRRCYCCVW